MQPIGDHGTSSFNLQTIYPHFGHPKRSLIMAVLCKSEDVFIHAAGSWTQIHVPLADSTMEVILHQPSERMFQVVRGGFREVAGMEKNIIMGAIRCGLYKQSTLMGRPK